MAIGLWALMGCAPENRCGSAGPAALRVLFIGNSYTAVNDLPAMFARLACSAGKRVETGMVAPGGWTLSQHAASPDTRQALQSQTWDIVVLQEQSQIPANEPSRQASMYPGARELVRAVRAQNARPFFFLTWGHRDGWPENRLYSYAQMQAALYSGYVTIAHELNADVAPVGSAWQAALSQPQPPELWQPDGSHATPAGTYLAACVFYASFFGESPQGLAYYAGLGQDTAQSIQAVAAETVLGKAR